MITDKIKNIVAVMVVIMTLGIGLFLGGEKALADCTTEGCSIGERCHTGGPIDHDNNPDTPKVSGPICVKFASGLGFPAGFEANTSTEDPSYAFLGDKDTQRRAATTGDFGGLLVYWTNFALYFLASLFLVYLIYNGFQYLTAMGDEDKVKEANKAIWRALVGIMIIFAAYAIVNMLTNYVNQVIVEENPGQYETLPGE